MSMTLADKSIVILAANGFDENHMTAVQRTLTKANVAYKVVAPEQGLVNGWQDNAWGHYFPVNESIGTTLGSDYDALILLGGERAIAKLKTNPHTKRLVNHFLEAGKAVAAIEHGVQLLMLSPCSAGRTVSGVDADEADLASAQIELTDEPQTLDGALLTSDGQDTQAFVDAALKLIEVTSPFDESEESQAA